MRVGRSDDSEGELVGIKTLLVLIQHRLNAQAIEFESDLVARTIRHCLDNRITIPRTPKEIVQGIPPHSTPADFLIVTWQKRHLSAFARKLSARESLPASQMAMIPASYSRHSIVCSAMRNGSVNYRQCRHSSASRGISA